MTPDADTPAERIQQHIEDRALADPQWALAWATLQGVKTQFRAAVAMERFVAALDRVRHEDRP